MYIISPNLKAFAYVLIAAGIFGMTYGFYTAPKSLEQVEKSLRRTHTLTEEETREVMANMTLESVMAKKKHAEHVFHGGRNRPWTAFFIGAFFFLMISVTVLVFYAIQWAAQAGWSIVLFRVMESITAYILPGSILLFLFLLASAFHLNHMYAWMSPEAANDPIIQAKTWWLNTPGWLIRSFVYLFVYNIFRWMLCKNSLELDKTSDIKIYKKNFNLSIIFIVLFGILELFMSFDWLMSLDPHWYSQLYSFYVFSSMLVSGITVVALLTIYLKSEEELPMVNNSHIHDLAKYMFGFSIFWTYFWFDQFMLQWYANLPEEAAYFHPRLLGSYQIPFIGMVIMNFVFPILILMNSNYKRLPWFVVSAGIIILIGHYIDIFQLISPATVGDVWTIGVPEIGSFLFFLGVFLSVVLNALTKVSLEANGNPFMEESERYHY